MSKNHYISKIKKPKFIIALSIILLTFFFLVKDYIRIPTHYFSKKAIVAEAPRDAKEEVSETLSVVVASTENTKQDEIDLSISDDRDEEDAELHVKPEEIIQPNIIKNKSVNMAFTKIVTVHDLISKFLQNIEYSKELDKIEKADLPENLLAILEEMRGYNIKYLTNKDSAKTEVIFPDKDLVTKMIGRFIKVEKSSINLVAQQNMHDAIVKNIHIIEEYFYSRNLLGSVGDHD